jgi:hypothetical protein
MGQHLTLERDVYVFTAHHQDARGGAACNHELLIGARPTGAADAEVKIYPECGGTDVRQWKSRRGRVHFKAR